MELVEYNKGNVIIKMNCLKELIPIFSIFISVVQEYDQLDREIHNLEKDQIIDIENSLHDIIKKLSQDKQP